MASFWAFDTNDSDSNSDSNVEPCPCNGRRRYIDPYPVPISKIEDITDAHHLGRDVMYELLAFEIDHDCYYSHYLVREYAKRMSGLIAHTFSSSEVGFAHGLRVTAMMELVIPWLEDEHNLPSDLSTLLLRDILGECINESHMKRRPTRKRKRKKRKRPRPRKIKTTDRQYAKFLYATKDY